MVTKIFGFMRSNFPGFYSLSKELLDEVWGKAVLILDTNVLLDFYRVSPFLKGIKL